MGTNRRQFLYRLSLLTALPFATAYCAKPRLTELQSSITDSSSLVAGLRSANPGAFNTMLAQVNASGVSRDPHQFQQSMHALTRIYKESRNANIGEPQGAAAALDRVKQIVQQQQPWDPETFKDFTDFLNSAAYDPTNLNLALNNTKYFVGLLDPPAAVVLQGESIVYDWISATGVLSSPPPPLDILQDVGTLAFKRIMDLDPQQSFIGSALNDPALSGIVKISPRADDATVYAALPDAAKAVCSATIPGGTNNGSEAQIAAWSNALNGQVQRLKSTNQELFNIIKSQADQATKERRATENAANYARINQEISAAINITSFLLGHLIGSTNTRVVTGLASAAQSLANAINAYTNGTMGVLSLCNSFLVTGQVIGSLINPGETPEQLILRGINELKTQIDEFRRDVDIRLSVIDRKQDAILNGISKMYEDLMNGQSRSIDLLDGLQLQLAELAHKIDVQDRQNKQDGFSSDLSAMRAVLGDRDSQSFRSNYIEYLTRIGSFGLLTALNQSFVAADYYSLGTPAVSAFSAVVHANCAAENLVGLLAPMCRNLKLTPTVTKPPNFVAWMQSTNAYLEARRVGSDIRNQEFDRTLVSLLRTGNDLRSALLLVSSGRAIRTASREYLLHAITPDPQWELSLDDAPVPRRTSIPIRGRYIPAKPRFTLTGFVSDHVSTFLSKLVPGFSYGDYAKIDTPKVEITNHMGIKGWVTDLRTSGEYYVDLSTNPREFKIATTSNLSNDPFNKCISAQLIQLNPTISFDDTVLDIGSTHTDCFKLQVLYGPDRGKTFGAQKTLRRIKSLQRDSTSYYWRWVSPDPTGETNAPFDTTTGLLDYCENLVNRVFASDKVRSDFALSLREKLREPQVERSLIDFYAYGATLRLFSTLARMRQLSGDEDMSMQSDVRNIDGIFTADELVLFVDKHVNQDPPLPITTHWPSEMSAAVSQSIKQSVTGCEKLSVSVPDNVSIGSVDQTLRTLATYMKLNNTVPG